MAKQRPTVRTISSNEAKQRWGALMNAVVDNGDEVVIESHGKPKVAVISYEEFQEFAELREQRRRDEALAWMRDFEKRQAEGNTDLTEEEVERIAIEVGREVNQAVNERWRQRMRDKTAE